MAKYTETLAEYVEGGGLLPSSSFDLIEGFEDLFKKTYCGSEIGFETETLFALKLDAKAAIVMPAYAEKIAVFVESMTGLKNNPIKWRYESRKYGAQHSENESHGSNTDLPIADVQAVPPSSTSTMDGSADTDAHTDEIEFKEGTSVDEKLRIIDAINKKAFMLVEACLEEFKPLFMGVY